MATILRTAAAPTGGRAALHVSLWIAQVALAFMFGMAGYTKAFTPALQLVEMMPWANDTGLPLARFIGVSELLGAIGLLLPALTRVKPVLTAWAGAGLAVVMVLATGFHVMRDEMQAIGMTLMLGAVAAFVAWGRFKGRPIEPR